MKILKFGGTSIESPARIRDVLDIITTALTKEKIAVVVSAFGSITDQLIEMAKCASGGDNSYHELLSNFEERHVAAIESLVKYRYQKVIISRVENLFGKLNELLRGVFLVSDLTSRSLDKILSFGERLSAIIICESLNSEGWEAEWLDARQIIITDSTFGSAGVDLDATYLKIRNYFKTHSTPQIITGFIASDSEGNTTTLGRSGSDYTASILGVALKAVEIEIWTDVNGLMTADPRKVPEAFPIKSMTYEDAMELSHFGARVIFPPTMQPAMSHNIPIRIRNTFNPEFEGTLISAQIVKKEHIVTGISSINDIALIQVKGSGMIGVTGISGRLFQALSQKAINVILISQASSEHSICFAVDPVFAADAKKAIEKEFELEIQVGMIDKVRIEKNLSIVAVVGENMRHTSGISGRVFSALGSQGINVIAIAQGSSERNISVVIAKEDEVRAINLIHNEFFITTKKTLDLFIVGTGLVGSELLRMINGFQRENINLRVLGLANSRKMIFSSTGISLDTWENNLSASQEKMNMETFKNRMDELKGDNPVFVDCTISEVIAKQYLDILSRSISVVTPNKIANTQGWDEYLRIRKIARKQGVNFFYETNVGASLPVIRTLKNLMECGDTVLKIEAVLSGTLSYLFNTFTGEIQFSDLVLSAKKKGFTEPDPRVDLSGLDAARKLLILVREMGYSLELDDILVENLLPEGSEEFESVEEFLEHLSISDKVFEKRRSQAEKQGKVLRYIAEIENGKAEVALKEVGPDHPFCYLSGSENIIAFTTKRYQNYPLFIRGPSSGAQVTAAGVLTDILNCT